MSFFNYCPSYINTRADNACNIYINTKYESVSFTVVQCLLLTLIRIMRKEKIKIRDLFFFLQTTLFQIFM